MSHLSGLADKFEGLRDGNSGLSYHNDGSRRELHIYGDRAVFLYDVLDKRGPEIAAALRKADATDETGWLIEWPEDELHKVRWYVPGKIFTSNASEALRFARKEDADAFLRKGEQFSMAGHAKAVEHAWIAPASCRAARASA
jgi:hypothetical protein